MKTSPEGKASYDGVPYGKLRVQVLARGFQTYGDDYEVHEPSMDITIKLKRPAKQYSIYEEHPKQDNTPAPSRILRRNSCAGDDLSNSSFLSPVGA